MTSVRSDIIARSIAPSGGGQATLVARVPESLAPGTYVFRADAVDGAGNHASTTRRAAARVLSLGRKR